jgi:glucose-1-phosphatase
MPQRIITLRHWFFQYINEHVLAGVIKNIIFDLGGVLLDLDFEKPFLAFRKLNRNGEISDLKQFLHHPVFLGLETGAISPEDFRQQIRLMLKNQDIKDEEIDQAWCSMLIQVPSVKVTLLQELAEKFRIFLFSNTNAIHIPYFSQNFFLQHQVNWESLFEKTFYSHEIFDRKPNASSYNKIINLAAVDPSETLFIDDLEQNIRAAVDAGLNVIHFIPGGNLREEIYRALNR